MIASTHLAVGAVAGLAIQRRLFLDSEIAKRLVFGFVAGYVSHLLLDAFPHQEYGIEGIWLGAVLFVEIITIFSIFLFSSKSLSFLGGAIVFLGMVGGAMPDFLGIVYENFLSWTGLGDVESIVHLFLHGKIPIEFEVNVYVQILIALASVALAKSELTKW